MEKEKQIDYTPGMKYCPKCAYYFNPIKGCDCSVKEIIEEVDNK